MKLPSATVVLVDFFPLILLLLFLFLFYINTTKKSTASKRGKIRGGRNEKEKQEGKKREEGKSSITGLIGSDDVGGP